MASPLRQACSPIGVASLHSRQGQAEASAAIDEQSLAPDVPAFSERDLRFIIRFCEEYAGDQFRALVHALCPAIYGHELIKARAGCALFGLHANDAAVHAAQGQPLPGP